MGRDNGIAISIAGCVSATSTVGRFRAVDQHLTNRACTPATEWKAVAPSTDGCRKPHLVVQALPAVEHHAQQRHALGQVLGGLRLARAGGPGGRAAQAVGERRGERHVAAVRERRDDQAAVEAHVLVAVLEQTYMGSTEKSA